MITQFSKRNFKLTTLLNYDFGDFIKGVKEDHAYTVISAHELNY